MFIQFSAGHHSECRDLLSRAGENRPVCSSSLESTLLPWLKKCEPLYEASGSHDDEIKQVVSTVENVCFSFELEINQQVRHKY